MSPPRLPYGGPLTSTLYFFRHVHRDACIVSPTYVLKAMHMAQAGNPHKEIKQHHWVPFLVATGLPTPSNKKEEGELLVGFWSGSRAEDKVQSVQAHSLVCSLHSL